MLCAEATRKAMQAVAPSAVFPGGSNASTRLAFPSTALLQTTGKKAPNFGSRLLCPCLLDALRRRSQLCSLFSHFPMLEVEVVSTPQSLLYAQGVAIRTFGVSSLGSSCRRLAFLLPEIG